MMVTGGKEDLGLSLSLGMGLMGCSTTTATCNKINNNDNNSVNVDHVPNNNGITSSSAMGMGMGMGMGTGLGFLMMNRTNPNPNHQLEKLPWNRSTDSFPLSSSDRVSSSNKCLRGIDVNRPAGGCELEDDAGVSSPNSTVSTLSGSKRSSSEQEGADHDHDHDHDEEEDENSRKKLRLSKDQSAVLEESFKEHNTLNPKQKLALAKRLGLRPRQVEVWFQNRRARTKLKQTEVDCEFLKRCCEQLTEENRRLQKEVQELRALKLSPQFYMQMTPPTTLTMCPSCERVASSSSATATTTNDLTSSRPGPSQAQAQAQAPPLNASNNALPLQLHLQLQQQQQQQQQHRPVSLPVPVSPWLPVRPFDTFHPRP